MKRVFLIPLVFFISIMATACGSEQLFETTITPSPGITLTPTSTFTPTSTPSRTPTPTPTPIGGSGQLLVGGFHCDNTSTCTPGIYRYDFSTHQTSLILDSYFLEGLSPDSKKLLVSQVKESANIYASFGKLYITNLDGSNPVLLSPNFDHSNTLGELNAYWFPETDLIAFRATENQKTQIFTIHSDGTGLSRVTQSNIGVRTFLPKLVDEELYWEEGKANYGYGWRRTKLDGTVTTKLENWDKPKISANGEHIAYFNTMSESGSFCFKCELDISRTDGSSDVKLSATDLVKNPSSEPGFDSYFWFPDSQRILVQIALCNPDCDTYKHVIISTSGELLGEIDMERIFFGDGAWSPDGRQYIFMSYVKTGTSFVTVPSMLNIETKLTQSVDPSSFNDIINAYSIFWLP